ncbi:MAG: lamin tail domain-containing protein [Lentimicrobiaceae bacterium]|nr:lamin tail domain-containing protein [Lentimicrobiaceae bacterium]
MKKDLLLTILVCIAISVTSYGQSAFTFTATNLTYTENFNSIGANGTTFPTGWKGYDNGFMGIGNDVTNLAVTNGNNPQGCVFNVGATNDPNRAIGTRASSSGTSQVIPIFGAKFTNSTDSKITQIDFTGICEQWRTGSNSVVERNKFAYSFDATSLISGTWIEVSAFDLYEIQTANTNTHIDGKNAANRKEINATVSGIEWGNGTDMWIRWTDNVDDGSNVLLAIDDLSITVTLEPQPTINITTPTDTSYWYPGTLRTISWGHENFPDPNNTKVDIHYTREASNTGGTWHSVASNIPLTQGSVTWAPFEAQYASKDCKIRITTTTPDPVVALSETFNLVGRFPNLYRLRNGNPGNYAPGVIGCTYKIRGQDALVYNAVVTFNQDNQRYYVQDAQDGITGIVIDANGKLATPYNEGDGLRYFMGTYLVEEGMHKLVLIHDPGTYSTGNVVNPQVVTIPNLKADFINYQAELIKLENVKFQSTGTFAANVVYTVIDKNGNTINFKTNFANADYIGKPIPTYDMDMIVLPNTTTDGNFVTSRRLGDFINFAVTSPIAGDSWEQGSTQNITWTAPSFVTGNVTIEYTKNASATSVVWENITTVPVTDGSFTWNIPQSQTLGTKYKIRLTAASGQVATSEMFSITKYMPKVFISEYIVGSGDNDKAIEIYNGTNAAIDLSKLEIRLYIDGSTTVSHTLNGLTGNLDAGNVYSICKEGAAASIANYCNLSTNNDVMTFNGNDAIEVVYNGTICDVFGEIGVNPGTGWTVAGTVDATANKTLLRKLNVTQGNTTAKGSFTDNEWVVKNQDYTANFGGFGAALTQNADYTLAASYDVDPTSITKFNLILNHNAVDVNKNFENINNLVIKNAENTTFTIQPNINLKIAGKVFNKLTGSTAAAKFNINSTEAGTGSLLHNFPAGGKIQRYISGDVSGGTAADCYHGVSVPLKQSENPKSILFEDSYLYEFKESENIWHCLGTSPNNDLTVNKGYLIYYPGASKTYEFEGAFNEGSFEIPYTYTSADKGYNFIPNPYPSHIDFSLIPKGNFANGFWIWSADQKKYGVRSVGAAVGTFGLTSDIISIGQAFFIKATNNGTITLNNNCRTNGVAPFYGTGNNPNILRVFAEGNQLKDEIVFVFDNKWNAGMDDGDMTKLYGSVEAPQLSSINADNEKLTINTLPLNKYETVVPLSFTLSVSTQVQFVADISSLQSDITPYLIDKKANRTVNLRQNPAYAFNHEDTDSDNRFELKLVNAVYSKPYDLADENVIYVNSNNQIVVSIPSMQNTKAMVNVYDMQGKLISSNTVFLTDTYVTQAPFIPGIYVVNVVNSTQVVNKKVVVTR